MALGPIRSRHSRPVTPIRLTSAHITFGQINTGDRPTERRRQIGASAALTGGRKERDPLPLPGSRQRFGSCGHSLSPAERSHESDELNDCEHEGRKNLDSSATRLVARVIVGDSV